MIRNNLREFILFIREKGVVGLAIGIIIGGAITKFVNAIVQDLITPLLNAGTGKIADFETLVYRIPRTTIELKIGDFISNFLNFIAIAAVVYFVFMKLPLLRDIDVKKEDAK